MNSVWSSLLPSQQTHNRHAEASPTIAAPSIWSHVPVSTQPQTTAAVSGTSGPRDAQLYHPRYVPGDPSVQRRLQQTRVKPLQVGGAYGGAGNLSERPVFEHELWGDSTRRRLPHGPDGVRLRRHNPDGRALFDITPAPQPAAPADAQRRRTGPLLSQREQARYGAPPPPDEALAALRLTNPATHVTRPGQLLPFATLMATVQPHPLSDAGFRPLVVECVADKWRRTLGCEEEQKQQQPQSEQHPELRPQTRSNTNTEDEEERSHDSLRRDIATSPMGRSPSQRSPSLSLQQRRAYSLALSPRRPHSGDDRDVAAAGKLRPGSLASVAPSPYEFPAAPPGVNPDAHLAQQARRVHEYSVKALQEQLAELRKEERTIDKAQRTSDKAAVVARRQWEDALGLSSVREGSDAPAESVVDAEEPAPAHHHPAFALDDEQEVATQTDATLALQHPWKPRVAARKRQPRDEGPPTEKERIEAEVAAEYAQKAAAAFGTRADKDATAAAAAKPAGAATLPRFQSHADAYRAQLQEQYRVVFDAQVAATQHSPRAGALIEARLKKLRDDTIFMRGIRMGRDDTEEKKVPGESGPGSGPDLGLPDTVIGSRTAALLFLDPQMMRRKPVPQQSPLPLDPAAADIPNRVVELTRRAEAALEAQLGFPLPRATFPGGDSAATHRPLQFASGSAAALTGDLGGASAGAAAATSAQATIQAPPSLTLAPEVESLFDTGAVGDSSLDHFPLFSGKPPLVAIKNECTDLDADVARLENTIRALHAEFAAPRGGGAGTKPPPPGTHPIVDVPRPDDEDDGDDGGNAQRGGGSRSTSAPPRTAAEEEEHRRMETAQRYLEQMDQVLGLPPGEPLASPRGTQRPSSARVATASGPSPRGPRQGTAFGFGMQAQQQQQHRPPRSSTTSTLVAALEQYLSIDMGSDALFPGGGGSGASGSGGDGSGSLVPQTASVQSFAAPSLNRPDEFTPQSLSPSFAKAAAAQAAPGSSSASASASAAPLKQQHPSRRVGESWEEELRLQREQADADEREQRQVEQMLQDQMDELHSPSPATQQQHRGAGQRPGSSGSASSSSSSSGANSRRSTGVPTRPLTPSGVRSSFASLSRVSESEHEDSRSYSSGGMGGRGGGGGSGGAYSARSNHRSASPLGTHRGGSVDADSSADDSHLWAQGGEEEGPEDTSMVMQVQRPPPLSYDDSLDEQSIEHPALPSNPRAAAGGMSSHVSPRYKHRAVLSPSAAQKRRSPEPLPLSPRAQQVVQPRSNRATELRMSQLLQQEADARRRAAADAAARPAHSSSSRPTAAGAAPVSARPKSGIELERERRRQKQLHGGGMVQASHDRAGEWRGPAGSLSPAPGRAGGSGGTSAAPARPVPLSASNDRLMREAQDMMAQFRQQLDSMPDLPEEHEHHQGHGQRGHAGAGTAGAHTHRSSRDRGHGVRMSGEYRPDAHEQSWEQELLEEHPHDRSDGPRGYEPSLSAQEEDAAGWFAPAPATELSWEQELADDSPPPAPGHHTRRPAARDRDPFALSDEEDDPFR